MLSCLRFSPRQRGAALVETVVISPLLLFLILLTAEITNAFVDHNTLTKSVRNGARYFASNAMLGTTGSIPPAILDPTTSQIRKDTINLVVFGNTAGTGNPILQGLDAGDVTPGVDFINNNIEVTVDYAYTGLLGGSLPSFGFGPDVNLGMTLQATVTMKAL